MNEAYRAASICQSQFSENWKKIALPRSSGKGLTGVASRLDKLGGPAHPAPMAMEPDEPLDLLWKEYSLVFRDFDDVTLAR